MIPLKQNCRVSNRVEYLIARRLSRGSDGSGDGSTMERVAAVAVALSVGVMIITLAVIFGFKGAIYSKLTLLSGDIVLTTPSSPSMGSHGSVGSRGSSLESVVRSGAVADLVRSVAVGEGLHGYRVAPYALRGATLRSGEGVEGVVLKGVDSLYNLEALEGSLVSGQMLDVWGDSPSRGALLSRGLASELQLEVGDRVELLVAASGGSFRRDLYRLSGIFSAGLGDGERHVVLTDLRNVQRLNGWGAEEVSGYEVWLSHDLQGDHSALAAAPYVSYLLNRQLLYGAIPSASPSEASLEGSSEAVADESLEALVAYSLQGLYPSIFDWLIAHNVNAVVILTIMTLVAAFNIITALLIMVLERTQMVGLLKALGMRNGAIRKIFLWRSLGIMLWGLAWGNGVALALCFVQGRWGVVTLDEGGYLLSAVPISLSVGWVAALNIAVVGVILVMVLLPTRFATTIEPSRAIKYQ